MAMSPWHGAALFAALFAVVSAALVGPTPALAQSSSEGKDEANTIREEADRNVVTTYTRGIHRAVRARVRHFQGPKGGPLRFGGAPTTASASSGPSRAGLVSGMSAGSVLENLTGWVDAGYTNVESDGGGLDTGIDIMSLTVGADLPLGDRLLVGLSGGITSTKGDAAFDTVLAKFESDSRSDNWTIAPYAAYILHDNIYVDLSLGFERSRTATNTVNRGTGATSISFGRDSNTYFISANLNYTDVIGGFQVAANIGHHRSVTRGSSFTRDQGGSGPSNDNLVSQLIIGGEAAYSFGKITPYALLAYEYDIRKAPRGGVPGLVGAPGRQTDRHALRFGLGLDAAIDDAITGTLEFTSVTIKDDYDEITLPCQLELGLLETAGRWINFDAWRRFR